MHISIMVKEILDFLKIQPGETGFDATLGYGGHTKAMLDQLQGRGHIYATDVDPEESAKTKKRLAEAGYGEEILTIKLQNFCTIDEIAKEVGGFDFWQIWEYLPCRSIIPAEDFLSRWTVR